MRRVTAREANQNFSKLLAEAEAGETILITKRGVEVAQLARPPSPAQKEAVQGLEERQAKIDRVIERMKEGIELPEPHVFDRDEIYDR